MRRVHGRVPARRHRGRRGLGSVLEGVLHQVVIHLETATDVIVDAGNPLESHVIIAVQARDVVTCAREPDAIKPVIARALLYEFELRAPQPLAASILDKVEFAQIKETVVWSNANKAKMLACFLVIDKIVLVALVGNGGGERLCR